MVEGANKAGAREIEYFYSIRSSFTYLGAQRLYALADRYGRRVVHRPVLLSIVVPAAGGVPFEKRSKAWWRMQERDMERWGEYLGIPINPDPVHHYGTMELPSGLVAAAQDHVDTGGAGDVDCLSFELLAALWRDDTDISDPSVTDTLCARCGFDSEDLRGKALSPAIQAVVKANSEEMVARGYIGAPTYAVDGEAFYGQDRLLFVERALAKT
ncbi:2-hydroxychromene-2-carboxylate isomerase [Hwanghaeella grinnelliae]|uniref:2-hydroxychromene-2-carboxylate isomerase n=1 Tax=Hwanghaeella grinnelliae TaxID=2500179 RepID=A0A437QTY6_9PROT|nr:2-hydroxychromene-2-carboxylate isomerase [Hwanghaeella grinnelliae]RVU37958.1 2-hydroxychromene-2-carboxylate isomerase [Hwanghaeella grinnelliae]